eukprot:6211232-Pleurochrysis_carterae.AAC.1
MSSPTTNTKFGGFKLGSGSGIAARVAPAEAVDRWSRYECKESQFRDLLCDLIMAFVTFRLYCLPTSDCQDLLSLRAKGASKRKKNRKTAKLSDCPASSCLRQGLLLEKSLVTCLPANPSAQYVPLSNKDAEDEITNKLYSKCDRFRVECATVPPAAA